VALVGLIVNPAAGRDIRRLTGGASVVTITRNGDPPSACWKDLRSSTIRRARWSCQTKPASDGMRLRRPQTGSTRSVVLDVSVTGERTDTRRAAERFRDDVDVVVVLGGDGTNRDVAATIGSVPVAAVSTGTNNVVPTPIDGTAAGAAAALVATGEAPVDDVTVSHGTVAATIDSSAGTETLRGLATLGVVDRSFVGTRAVLDASEFVGGVVSRAHPLRSVSPASPARWRRA